MQWGSQLSHDGSAADGAGGEASTEGEAAAAAAAPETMESQLSQDDASVEGRRSTLGARGMRFTARNARLGLGFGGANTPAPAHVRSSSGHELVL